MHVRKRWKTAFVFEYEFSCRIHSPLWKIYCKPFPKVNYIKWKSPLDNFHTKCVHPLMLDWTKMLYRGNVNFQMELLNISIHIEGLHDARTYTRTIFPAPWFPFCMAPYREKQQNMQLLLIYFIARFEISTECVFSYSCHSVVIWYCGMN